MLLKLHWSKVTLGTVFPQGKSQTFLPLFAFPPIAYCARELFIEQLKERTTTVHKRPLLEGGRTREERSPKGGCLHFSPGRVVLDTTCAFACF